MALFEPRRNDGSHPSVSSSAGEFFSNIGDKIKSGFEAFGDWLFQGNPIANSLNKALDLKGTEAAKTQFENQLFLDNSARAFNAQEAQKQRDFEKLMSNTQYQRAVADIKAAGLNPWLAVQNAGMSGNTPSGSSASSQSGQSVQANNRLYMAAGLIATALKMMMKK